MGCDIHMYVEYKRKDQEHYCNFGGRINPGRNYYLFGLLCKGIRSDLNEGLPEKGLPDKLAWASRSDSQLYITDAGEADDECSRENAERWVANGSSTYTDEEKKSVTHPDWHSHSWVTYEEFKQQYDIFNAKRQEEGSTYTEPEYDALLAALKSFHDEGYDTRIVFWFDN